MERKRVKKRRQALLLVLLAAAGFIGGLTEYMSPSLRVDEDQLKPP